MRPPDRAAPRHTLLLLACAALALVVACGGGGTTVRVAAAADLRTAFDAMRPDIEAACECDVVFVFGSSGLLREQIAAGASFAVYFSADEAFVHALAEEDAVLPDTVAAYAVGHLVLAWREGIEPVRSIQDLARPDLGRVTIANPAHAPYGRAARAALEAAGVWDAVEPRIVYGENIRQATDYVASGDADAGVLALALVSGTGTSYEIVPAHLHAPIVQAAAVVRDVDEVAGRAILDYVLSDDGQGRLRTYGFEAAP